MKIFKIENREWELRALADQIWRRPILMVRVEPESEYDMLRVVDAVKKALDLGIDVFQVPMYPKIIAIHDDRTNNVDRLALIFRAHFERIRDLENLVRELLEDESMKK